MKKAVMLVSKESQPCPVVSPHLKECLATFITVGGHQVWILWDTRSTMMGITPLFVDVVKITIFPLKNPHVLRLGTVGSRASVNFGMYIEVVTHGKLHQEYVDMANFDQYNMIIGMPFMRSHKVVLDFENDTVWIGMQSLSTTKVLIPDTNDRVHQYRTTERRSDYTAASMLHM